MEDKKKDPKKEVEFDEIPEKEAMHLRKFLKDGTEFRGLEKTVVAILKYNQDGRKNKDGRTKLKEVVDMVSKAFRLSEDYDSDSSADDENEWLLQSKKIGRKLKKSECKLFSVEDKYIKLA